MKDNQILGPCERTKNIVKHEGDIDKTIEVGTLGIFPKGLEKRMEEPEIRG